MTRKNWPIVLIAVLISLVLSGLWVHYWSFRQAATSLHESSQLIHHNLTTNFFEFYQNSLHDLSENRLIRNALIRRPAGNPSRVDELLTGASLANHADIVYLMDQRGKVIASSFWDDNKSLKGNNYQFRDYFAKALTNGNYIDAATGVTTQKKGIYFSRLVKTSEREKGVLVIKVGEHIFRQYLNELKFPASLVSPEGVIFISNQKNLEFTRLHDMDYPEISPEIHRQVYGGIRLQDLDSNFINAKLLYKSSIPMDPWQLAVWTESRIHPATILAGGIVWIVLSALLIMTFSFLQFRRTSASESQAQIQTILKLSKGVENSPAVVIITDKEGSIEYVNKKFTEITGYSVAEALGKNPRILKHGHQPDSYYKALWETITSGKDWNGEFENQSKDGRIFYENALISPIKNDQDEITHFIAIKEDITDKKRVNLEKQELQNQIFQAGKLASMGTMGAGIAHELNNPLTVIQAGAQQLLWQIKQGSLKEEELKTQIIRIENQALRMAKVINHMREFNRDAGSLPSELMDPHLLIENSLLLLTRQMELSNIQVELKKTHRLPWIKVNPVKMESVLQTVLVNAKDALEELPPNRSRRLIIKTCYDASVNEISIRVSDNAAGVPEEDLDRVFDPFFTNKPVGKGIGLGLTLAHTIMKEHEGNIDFQSQQGLGTSVTLTLPAATDPLDQPFNHKDKRMSEVSAEDVSSPETNEDEVEPIMDEIEESKKEKTELNELREIVVKEDESMTDDLEEPSTLSTAPEKNPKNPEEPLHP